MTVCSLTILLPLSNTGCYKQTPKTNGFRTDFSLRIPIAKAKTVEEALAYLDSLEQTGTLPEAEMEFLRALPYLGVSVQPNLAETHLKKAWELYSLNPAQDWIYYSEVALKYSGILINRGNNDKATEVIIEAIKNVNEVKDYPDSWRANLLHLMATIQVEFGSREDGDKAFEELYQIKQKCFDRGEDKTHRALYLACFIPCTEYFNVKDFEKCKLWIDRALDNLKLWSEEGVDSLKIKEEQASMSLMVLRYQHAIGNTAEASRICDSIYQYVIQKPSFGTTLWMADYLKNVGRYAEAVKLYDCFDKLYPIVEGNDLTFETFQTRFAPRYTANRRAGNTERALLLADSIYNNIDSAMVKLYRDNAAELAFVYQTHEKELALKEAQAESRIHRNLLISAIIIIFLVGYLFLRSHLHNKELLAKNRSLFEQIQQREQEEQDKLQALQAQPEETLTPEQQLYRRICALMVEKQPYTDEELNREMLAKMLDSNTTYIVEAIRECSHGETVMDFITRYRLEQVAHLLKTTDEPINLIGDMSGIPSRTTLARLFRNTYGMTCREYRQVARSTMN